LDTLSYMLPKSALPAVLIEKCVPLIV